MSACLTCSDKGWVPLHPDSPCDCYMPCVSCGGGSADRSHFLVDVERRIEQTKSRNEQVARDNERLNQ